MVGFGEAVSAAEKDLGNRKASGDSAESYPATHKLPLLLESWGARSKGQAPHGTFWLSLSLDLGTRTLGGE